MDHKRIGILYVLYAVLFLVVGGIEATLMRLQLGPRPQRASSRRRLFNQLFTLHGTTMIFFVAMPLMFGFANYLVPLMIGARDMAFPRLNAFSFWLTAFGGFLLYFSLVGGYGLYGDGCAPDVGWFAYAPLTSKTFSPRAQHRLLDPGAAGLGIRQHRHGDQHHRHRLQSPLSGDDPGADAAPGLAQPGDGDAGHPRRRPAHRGAG